MKNGIKMALLGATTLSCGFLIGFKTCQKITLAMLKDKEYINKKIIPIIEREFGKDKLETVAKILYDTGVKVKDKDIVLASRSDAEEVLTQLRALLNDYGFVTVSDLYDLVGITSKITDNKYGWTDLKTAVIKGVRTGYLLDLPIPQEIK